MMVPVKMKDFARGMRATHEPNGVRIYKTLRSAHDMMQLRTACAFKVLA